MALSENDIKRLSAKLTGARSRIVMKNPFFGSLLTYLSLGLDEDCPTACTNGKFIAFGTGFADRLEDDEIEFVMLHELMHCALGHAGRRGKRNHYLFNVAADIVINSILLEYFGDPDPFTIDGKEVMHLTPIGIEGRKFSSERVYDMLMTDDENDYDHLYEVSFSDDHRSWGKDESGDTSDSGSGDPAEETEEGKTGTFGDEDSSEDESIWAQRIYTAAETTQKSCGSLIHLPGFFRNYVRKLRSRKIDWHNVLSRFCQNVSILDYSWERNDRRFCETEIFIPDYSYVESRTGKVSNILFFVDTSGSVDSTLVSTIMAEIRNAISVFDGKLEGSVGFFDTGVIPPVPFRDEESFDRIAPSGGGGTSFACIFDYVSKNYADDPPAAIVILTDGYAPFPPKAAAGDIPVLWLICSSPVVPPWGEFTAVEL